MRIGIIGYGHMASALGSRWAHEHELVIGGRDCDRARALADELGGGTRAGSSAEAVDHGEIVVLATPASAVYEGIEAAGGPGAFEGRIVIDINNPVPGAFDGDFIPRTDDGRSLAEGIGDRLPGARVVKAFNMCQAAVWRMQEPVFDGRRLTALYCGDDGEAKAQVAQLIDAMGPEPVDVGPLAYARLLEPAAAIVIRFLFAGRDPHTVLQLIQPESKSIA